MTCVLSVCGVSIGHCMRYNCALCPQATVSLKRLRNFLLNEELDTDNVTKLDSGSE